MDKNQKKIKLQPRHRNTSQGQKIIPELKLSGVWLEKLGFKPGEKVAITISEEQLIISTIKPEML